MSLLIKALDKAQAEKAQAKGGAEKKSIDKPKKRTKPQGEQISKTAVKQSDEAVLSLSPPEEVLEKEIVVNAKHDEVPQALKGSAADVLQQEAIQKPVVKPEVVNKDAPALTADEAKNSLPQAQAANVFTAKRIEPTHQTAKLALIAGSVALMIMAALFYWYQSVMNIPDIVIPPKPVISQEMPQPLPELPAVSEETLEPENILPSVEAVVMPDAGVQEPKVVTDEPVKREEQQRAESVLLTNITDSNIEETLTPNEVVVDSSINVAQSNTESLNVDVASEIASVKVTQAKTESGVNPILMRAYEAYNAGQDKQAQQDYKQVLQRYGSNVDAMLGLGSIAARQGRLADANGWYRKVLEVEPRNDVATAGLISIQQKNQPQNNESNIKSMLATAPNDANLHAALGDVYASRGQWSAAQQAYFDAYRLNPSVDNAFNLGVSLDQLGKPKLALPYYQEALQKAGQSNVIDVAALEARISSIQ
jgi:tetratricopeptide (TPR) repeat protein